ncbi:hypothetical protein HDU87_003003 [Geranomyces variabilis]|uniref:Uncharacterized protein n=1 Tax=Geranomyces variabilis TaxID=109894 RepID=A0AAD5TQT8_9FUNG|nr:hypothetical protein HDU87_003003 [Geranomyces variabilis]
MTSGSVSADAGPPAAPNPLVAAVTPYLPPFLVTLLHDPHVLAFVMALVASMGTFIGGVVVVVLAKLTAADPNSPATAKLMGVLQAFSAGVMLYITCFDLIPEATEILGGRECMGWFFAGVLAFGILEEVILPDEHGHDHDDDDAAGGGGGGGGGGAAAHRGNDDDDDAGAAASITAAGAEIPTHPGAVTDASSATPPPPPPPPPPVVVAGPSAKERRELLRSSFITFVALAMHNLPEGLGVYLSALSDIRLGSQLAMAILLHNIPEGMAVAIPLYAATGNATKVLWWTLVNGLAEPLGVVVGGALLHSYLSPALLSRCLAAVGGIMACISIHELQPTAIKYAGKGIATSSFFGGMLVCFAALEAVNEWFGGHVH